MITTIHHHASRKHAVVLDLVFALLVLAADLVSRNRGPKRLLPLFAMV